MFSFRLRSLCVAALAFALSGGMAAASTVGVAVDGIGSNTTVGSTAPRPALGGKTAIEYFIPLSGSDCTYGVDGCGVSSDDGSGGPTLTMFLRFDPVSTTSASTLNIYFEDLDLANANDPAGFLETVNILDKNNNSITSGVITDISNLLVTGNSDTQQILSLSLGVLPESPYFLALQFTADYRYPDDYYNLDKAGKPRWGRNTPEYLVAEISAVPIPAAGFLLIGALGAMGAVARRRRQS